jgi:aminoglycoside phosphotransferase (APT) family kinase protein
MTEHYIGYLPKSDPLYNYFRYDIGPQITGCEHQPAYRVCQLNGSNDVYLYEEKNCGYQLVGKFFLSSRKNNRQRAERRMNNEFHNLQLVRSLGLEKFPHYVVRPYGYNYELNCILVVEYKSGKLFSTVIDDAIYHGGEKRLYKKLTALAYFLATFHNRSAVKQPVNFENDCKYLDKLIATLLQLGAISQDSIASLYILRDAWRRQTKMWEDSQVLVHGDATPDNFLFGKGLEVVTFDLERLKRADRVFDLGRVAGELKHFFLRATGSIYAAESYIGHFLWEYSCHFPDREQAFFSITRRIPFHIGLTLLRIARNTWITPDYRRILISEAQNNFRRFA